MKSTMKLTEPRFTFAEVLAATGASEAWLRTFIQRAEPGTLGTKDERLRRILFSGADIARIAVLYDLNARLKVSPAGAWEVAKAIDSLWLEKAKAGDTSTDDKLCVGFASDGELLCWRVNKEGQIETFNDAADERMPEAVDASRRTHIAVPILRGFIAVGMAMRIAAEGERGE